MAPERAFEPRGHVAEHEHPFLPGVSRAERRPAGPDREAPARAGGSGFARDLSGVPVTDVAGTLGPLPKQQFKRGGFLQSLGTFFTTLFSGTNFSNADLTKYLAGLARRHDIEGDIDSDNKARAVVDRWNKNTAGFSLTGLQKMLLIKELQDGATADDDERAILDILKRSEPGDLRIIFGYIPVNDLLGDFDGAEKKELIAWIELRFDDGLDGLRTGNTEPGSRLPTDLPQPPYDAATLLAKFDTDQYLAAEVIAELGRRSPVERERASSDLMVARTTLQRRVHERTDAHEKAPDQKAKDAIKAEVGQLVARLHRMDMVMEEVFKDIVLTESSTDLASKKKTLTPDQKVKAKEALRPKVDTATGAPHAFVAKHATETEDYTEKLRALMPAMITAYWDNTAKDRQPADHADSSKMHTLLEMEALAKVSKDETDGFYGGYYNRSLHPAMKADRPGRRGNLHDLWADMDRELRGPFSTRQAIARALVFYFLQTNSKWVAPLNRHHYASPRFDSHNRPLNDEAIAQETIATEFTTTADQVRRLNDIDRAWDASANFVTRDVNIQLFKPEGGAAADQDFMWDMFQTLIHEYLHTLVHPDYARFANVFGGSSPEQNTLMEGVDSFLSEIAWASIVPRATDSALREKVEGPDLAKLPPIAVKHAYRRRYPSYTEAVRLVNIVGFRNVVLAYFKGEIGGLAHEQRTRHVPRLRARAPRGARPRGLAWPAAPAVWRRCGHGHTCRGHARGDLRAGRRRAAGDAAICHWRSRLVARWTRRARRCGAG